MIVYFSKKSKDSITRLVIGIFILLIICYVVLIWLKIIKNDSSTIQIIRVEETNYQIINDVTTKSDQLANISENAFVASKIGKYYYPINCSKAKSLSAKNMLYFKDKMTAERAGFKEYLGCK